MARKETITKQMILEAAFTMAETEGYREVSARKLAAHIGCSTQPIFRVYTGMEDLQKDYTDKSVDFFQQYYREYTRKYEEPFVDLGMAYIEFARKYPHLFELLFMVEGKRPLYEVLNGVDGNVVKEIRKCNGGSQSAENLFMKMWIFIHGAACMTTTGDYDLSEEATARLLIDTYRAYTGR